MTGLLKLALPFPQIAAGLGASALLMGALAGIQTWRFHHRGVELAAANDHVARLQRAAATAIAAGNKIASLSKETSDATDAETVRTVTVYRDRVMRIPAATAARASEAGIPKGLDGPGGETVLLSRSDALICADNTGRLEQAHDWALKTQALLESGTTVIEQNMEGN